MRKEVPTPIAVGIIIVAIVVAITAVIWGMNRRAGNPEEIEKIIQAGVVGGGAQTPPAAQRGVMPRQGGPTGPTITTGGVPAPR